jgi:uncharacterized RDD family membrane protein YckC
MAFIGDLFTLDAFVDSTPLAIVTLAALAAWAFTYFASSLAVAGKTIGMGLVGLLVVARSGTALPGRAALVRTLVFPFSLPLGLGFIGLLFGRERRALHDLAASTAVVYDWGVRPAESVASRWRQPPPPADPRNEAAA